MSETLQRDDHQSEMVEPGILGGGDYVLEELERQAAELEQQRRLASRDDDQPHDASDDVDAMYLKSMLDTDPEKVIRALVGYLKGRKNRG